MNKSPISRSDEYFTRMNELRAERTELQAWSVDPQKWNALAVKYEQIGAICNAGECKRRALYYASLSEV